jgi:hypothetical protein
MASPRTVWSPDQWKKEDADLGFKVADLLDPPPNPYAENLKGWVHEVAGEETWSAQDEILESVVNHPCTGVWSCHGAGKSHIGSRVMGAWMDSHPVDDVFIVSSAPSAPQVRGILWRYLKDLHRKAGLPGNITEAEIPEWKINGRLVGWGRKPANLTSPEAAKAVFQGIHAKYVLVVFDEADGIPKWLWDAAKTLLTNPTNRLLAIGNPDNPNSEFARIRKDLNNEVPEEEGDSYWNKITISAYDTPAYTDEDVSQDLKDHLVSKSWVRSAIRDWGETNPLTISKVHAQYPEIGDDALITPAMIQKAIQAWDDLVGDEPGRYAADIARLGSDKCVVYRNRGGRMELVKEWGKADTAETTDKLVEILHPHRGGVPMVIDIGGGLGAGPFDQLRKAEYPVFQFDGSMSALSNEAPRPDGLRFLNRRAEQSWGLREELDASAIGLDPKNLKAQAQLLNITFDRTATGRIFIEKKEEIKKRTGESPDHADTIMMATVETDEWELEAQDREATRHSRAPSGTNTDDLLNAPA